MPKVPVMIDDPSLYKPCRKKTYDIHVCMPAKGSVVVNKLEQLDTVKMLGGKTYFRADTLKGLQQRGDSRFNVVSQLVSSGRAYVVNDATPFVLCGTVGELWTIAPQKLQQTYTFLSDGMPVGINQQTLQARMIDGVLPWSIVRVSASSDVCFACFVPLSQKMSIATSWGAVLAVNAPGISHGKGDFILCSRMPNGQPNLGDRWVVNGEIFANTYDNRGWTDCLKSSSHAQTSAVPKELIGLV